MITYMHYTSQTQGLHRYAFELPIFPRGWGAWPNWPNVNTPLIAKSSHCYSAFHRTVRHETYAWISFCADRNFVSRCTWFEQKYYTFKLFRFILMHHQSVL